MGISEHLFMPYPIGSIIGGRYRLSGILGRGGMGVVYAADDLKLAEKQRAIKVISLLPDGGRYAEEAQMLMKMEHPHLPAIFDYYPPKDDHFEIVVMEYIDGFTISQMLSSVKMGFTFAQLLDIGLQLCSALHYLHGHQPPIIHRDLKPSNVMMDKKGKVKLIDFGISRQYQAGKVQDTLLLGTNGFAAPEQAGSGQSDERTDIYGLGALLYFMASGGKMYNLTVGHKAEPKSMSLLQPNIPEAFKMVLGRMLHVDPSGRYRTIAEVVEALSIFAEPKPNNKWTVGQATRNQITQKRHKLIGLLSMGAGAGATFLTHSLAIMLGRQGASVTAIEFEHKRPEWHVWLSGNKRIRNIDPTNKTNLNHSFVEYKHDDLPIQWLSLPPESNADSKWDELRFTQMLDHVDSIFQLIDFSSRWNDPSAMTMLKQTQLVIVIGDPNVVKWQASEIKQLVALKQQLQASGGNLIFLANKDMSFHGRSEWISLFPQRPEAIVPRLPEEIMLSLQWKGRWATEETRLYKRLNQALLPILKPLFQEMITK